MSFGSLGRASSVRRALRRAYAADDADGIARALAHLTELRPGDAAAWFDRGLHAKRQRDWALSAECNARALELERDGVDNPSAWNLGIAATALADWPAARRAWLAYGIALPPEEQATGSLGSVRCG
jgi:tetratricopeptide (TPR) repeat protein